MMPKSNPISIDDIQGDVCNLAHLLDEITFKVLGLDHSGPEGDKLQRIGSLMLIARDLAEQTEERIGSNFAALCPNVHNSGDIGEN